jgi:hypothetical protein
VLVDKEKEKIGNGKITVKVNSQAKGLNVPHLRKVVWDILIANPLQILHIKVQE